MSLYVTISALWLAWQSHAAHHALIPCLTITIVRIHMSRLHRNMICPPSTTHFDCTSLNLSGELQCFVLFVFFSQMRGTPMHALQPTHIMCMRRDSLREHIVLAKQTPSRYVGLKTRMRDAMLADKRVYTRVMRAHQCRHVQTLMSSM